MPPSGLSSSFQKNSGGNQQESELLLDVIGDDEPIELSRAEFAHHKFNAAVDNEKPNRPLPQNTAELMMYDDVAASVKLEEFDVGRLLSDNGSDAGVNNSDDDDDVNEEKDHTEYAINNDISYNDSHNYQTMAYDNNINNNTNNYVIMTASDVATCPTSPESLPSSPQSPTPSTPSTTSIEDAINDAISISELCGDELSLVDDARAYRMADQLGVDDQFMACASGDLQDPFADLFPSLM